MEQFQNHKVNFIYVITYRYLREDHKFNSDKGEMSLIARDMILSLSNFFHSMFSDKRHFGLIVSQGRGKYACHVCEEYKV